jgi:hypothetical protein
MIKKDCIYKRRERLGAIKADKSRASLLMSLNLASAYYKIVACGIPAV